MDLFIPEFLRMPCVAQTKRHRVMNFKGCGKKRRCLIILKQSYFHKVSSSKHD